MNVFNNEGFLGGEILADSMLPYYNVIACNVDHVSFYMVVVFVASSPRSIYDLGLPRVLRARLNRH